MISGDRALAQGKQGAFYNTLEEFHKYWEQIDIITPPTFNFLKPKTHNLKPITYFDNVFIHPSPWPLVFQPLWILKKGQALFRENKFDLMTVHEYAPFYNGLGTRMLWGKTRLPYVLEIHHITGYPRAANLKERFYCWLTKRFIKYDSRTAQAVRIVNQNQLGKFLRAAGVPADKLIHIPSAYIDLEIFRPLNLEKKYDLIFVGRLAKNKGVDLFVEAAAKISGRSIIVGDGPLEEKLKTKSYKLKANVVFHGWARDSQAVARLLNQSKLLVMTSYSEGNPRVVAEAMACGVPILATPVGIVPDLLKNGLGGEIIDWRPDDIAQKAPGLLNDPNKYQGYSHDGPEIAKQFEKKEAIRNYADKLKKILG